MSGGLLIINFISVVKVNKAGRLGIAICEHDKNVF